MGQATYGTGSLLPLRLAAGHAGTPSLVSLSLRRRILRDVFTAHVVLILLPGAWFFVKHWLDSRKPPVITVRLVNAQPEPSPAPAPEQPAPAPPTPPAPPPPTPPAPTPPKPAPTPPKPTPIPTPTPPKPTWQPRSAKDITISKDVVKNSQPAPPQVSAADIEARLRSRQMRVGPVGPVGPVSQIPASYYETVASFLYQRWAQPGRAELGGRKPTVAVSLSLDASGRVKSASITRRSGIAPMDASVEALLAGLTTLPAPPNGAMTLSVNLEIVDN